MVNPIRKLLVDSLTLPKRWTVLPYNDAIGPPTQPVVMVFQEKVERQPQSPQGARLHTLHVYLLVPQLDPSKADDALDDALDTLISAIESSTLPGLKWSGAERVVVAGLPAYDLSVSTHSEKE